MPDVARALSPSVLKFVRDWGGVAERWGLDRIAGEVHAMLYLSPRPLGRAAVASALGIAEADAAAALASLVEWSLVRTSGSGAGATWEAVSDPVEMLRVVVAERRRREFDPAVTIVRDAVLRVESDGAADPVVARRLEDLQDVMRLMQGFHTTLSTLPAADTRRLLKLAQKIRQSLGG